MKVAYILIVLLNAGDAGFTAEFFGKDSCEIAGKTVTSGKPQATYYCLEK